MNSLTLTVELLLFGFRIYVERVAETSDVRPAGRGEFYVGDAAAPAEPGDNFSESRASAYEWVDDRVFDISPSACEAWLRDAPIAASLARRYPGGNV